ncbi:MAG: glycosyl transferase [Halochromatium sp.]|nr:glycosyl transferase [Halochromatium sp.]
MTTDVTATNANALSTTRPQTHDARFREAVIERYANLDRRSWLQCGRFHAKRLSWVLVVNGSYLIKRVLDISVATVAMLLLSPLFLVTAIAIRLESPGAVFFKQKRVGRWGQLFTIWKFRSMYADAEARKAELMAQNEMQGGVLFKMKDDPRVTKVGRFIRKTSIDELPQLWNVLMGDMSLVGPRPPVPSEVDQYSLSDRRRLEVIPGITCIWQVSGRSEIPFEQQVELDVEYIQSQSLWTDFKILLKTVPALMLGSGAY